jgi:hypothetical protein
MSIKPVIRANPQILTDAVPDNALALIAGYVPNEAAGICRKFVDARIASLVMEDFQHIVRFLKPSNSPLVQALAGRAFKAFNLSGDIGDPNVTVTEKNKINIVRKYKELAFVTIGNYFTNLQPKDQALILNHIKAENLDLKIMERLSCNTLTVIASQIWANEAFLLIVFFNENAAQTPTEYILRSSPESEVEWQVIIPKIATDLSSVKSMGESGHALYQEMDKLKDSPEKYERFLDWLSRSINYKASLPECLVSICLKEFDFSENNNAYQIIRAHSKSKGLRRFSSLTVSLLPHLNRYQLIEEMTDSSEGAGTVHPIAFRHFYEVFSGKYSHLMVSQKTPLELLKFFRSNNEMYFEALPEPEEVGLESDVKGTIAIIDFALAPETDPSYLEIIFSGRYPISDEFLKAVIVQACKTDDPKLANTILSANIKNRLISEDVLIEFARMAVRYTAPQVFEVLLKRERNIDLIAAAQKAIEDKKSGFIKRIIQHLEKQMNNPQQSYGRPEIGSNSKTIGVLASAVVKGRLGIDVLNSMMVIMKTIAKTKNMGLDQLGADHFFVSATSFNTPKEYFEQIFNSKVFNEPWGDLSLDVIHTLWNTPSVLQENKRRVHKIFTSGTCMSSKRIIELLLKSHDWQDGLIEFVLPRIPFELLCEVSEEIQVYEDSLDADQDLVQKNREDREAVFALITSFTEDAKRRQQSVLGTRPAPLLDGPPHLRHKKNTE